MISVPCHRRTEGRESWKNFPFPRAHDNDPRASFLFFSFHAQMKISRVGRSLIAAMSLISFPTTRREGGRNERVRLCSPSFRGRLPKRIATTPAFLLVCPSAAEFPFLNFASFASLHRHRVSSSAVTAISLCAAPSSRRLVVLGSSASTFTTMECAAVAVGVDLSRLSRGCGSSLPFCFVFYLSPCNDRRRSYGIFARGGYEITRSLR